MNHIIYRFIIIYAAKMTKDFGLDDYHLAQCKNQHRISQYTSILFKQYNIESDIDSSLMHLFQSQLFTKITQQLQIQVPTVSNINLGVFNEIVLKIQTQIQKDQQEKYNSFLNCYEVLAAHFNIYDMELTFYNMLKNILQIYQQLEQSDNFPSFDFNNNDILKHIPTQAEIQTFISISGADCLSVIDINNNLEHEPKFYSNNLWAVYILLTLSSLSLSLQIINAIYYIAYRGATASDISNLSSYFNLVQIPFSIFWLWISDKIGRKTVYIIINIIYALTSILFIIISYIVDNQIAIIVMQTLRGLQGSGAVLTPISFLMATDLAPPKIRGFVVVLVNVFALTGSLLSFGVQFLFSALPKYKTTPEMTFQEIFLRISFSFFDSQITAMLLFVLNLLIAICFLKESSQSVNLKRYLKKNKLLVKTKKIAVKQKLIINKNIIILFLGYLFSLTADNNLRIGGNYYILKSYGFTNPNESKEFLSTVSIVALAIAILLVSFGTKFLINKIGECRAIILAQYLSIGEAIINFSINPPLNPNIMYLTITTSTIASIYSDSLFLQLLSMYTRPETRGKVMGLFQIGNSIGRTSAGFIVGQMQNYNYRNTLILNTMFQSTCLFLVAILNPPLQRTEMDEAQKQKEENQRRNLLI